MNDFAVILCARMASQRLPGKALSAYCPSGKDNLQQIILRWRNHSDRKPLIIVSTTDAPEDSAIEAACRKVAVPCFRGDSSNVLKQMSDALWQYAPDAKFVARALADNPLVDVPLADWHLDILRDTGADGLFYGGDEARLTYAATTDIWSRTAWEQIVRGSKGSQLEHPGLFFWDNIDRFRVVQLPLPRLEYLQPIKTELDTQADLDMLRLLWNEVLRVDGGPEEINTLVALKMLQRRPEIAAINATVPIKTQAKAVWTLGAAWICPDCRKRAGTVADGSLKVRCARCGTTKTWWREKTRG